MALIVKTFIGHKINFKRKIDAIISLAVNLHQAAVAVKASRNNTECANVIMIIYIFYPVAIYDIIIAQQKILSLNYDTSSY